MSRLTQDLRRLEESCAYKYKDIRSRKPGLIYAEIEITSCKYKGWWYENLIGLEFLAEIRTDICRYTGKIILKEAFPVTLTKNTISYAYQSVISEDFNIL